MKKYLGQYCIGVLIISIIIRIFWQHKKQEDSLSPKIEQTINISQQNTSSQLLKAPQTNKNKADLKIYTRILFIDDEKFNVVNILKRSGWVNTSSIKDIDDLDSIAIKQANIIFIDINGVGTKLQFKNQGIGLAGAIKDKYPEKRIVIYSAETTGNRFDKILQRVDYSLPKNAEPYEFIQLVEQFAAEIHEEKNN